MKEKINQMFKDKLFLVMLVLGLLTIVAAAGVVTIQRGDSQNENPSIKGQGEMIAEDNGADLPTQVAGNANAEREENGDSGTQAGITSSQEEQGAGSQYAADQYGRNPYGENQYENGNQQIARENITGENEAAAAGTGMEAAVPLMLNFDGASRMAWPVEGNILLDYSMDTTIYFPTLAQYQVNPGIVIQAEVSQPVAAPANARVTAVSADEELGNYVVLDLGNEYAVTCGQLKEIQVVENEYLEAGQVLGYVAEPTKYYSVEGSNVFLELRYQGKAVDPLDYLE